MGNVFHIEAELEDDAREYWETPPSKRGKPDNLMEAYVNARTEWAMQALEQAGIDFDTNESWHEILDYSDETGIPPIDLIVHNLHDREPDEIASTLDKYGSLLLDRGLTEPTPRQYGGAIVEDVSGPTLPGVGRYTEEGKQGFLESVNEVRAENNLPPLNEAQSEDVLTALFVMRSGFAELERIKGSPIEE